MNKLNNKSKTTYLIIALLLEASLVGFVIWQLGLEAEKRVSITNHYVLTVTILTGLVVSNIVSSYIVGYLKDEILWSRTGRLHPGDPNRTLKNWWDEQNLSSSLSSYLGIVERFILAITGIVSFKLFFAAAGVWTTIKIAVDWQQFKEMKYRVIGHIYLISSGLSLILVVIDIVAIRILSGLPLLSEVQQSP